ncbi:hypothetical protein N7449_000948 [Penicillium cf. viridicatum]|uniref:Uncharacterized protein n=1 Tax=Penicillium cf. viridicatum TaxID=2972119 RepID=A0A9W9N5W7_9EURO|nr:hypothetical protein N7449_000948 [Penicillium cf. viridicatum]
MNRKTLRGQDWMIFRMLYMRREMLSFTIALAGKRVTLEKKGGRNEAITHCTSPAAKFIEA